MPDVRRVHARAKEAVDSVALLAPEELETLKALEDAKSPISSIEMAYELALLPHEAEERLASLREMGLVAAASVKGGEPPVPKAEGRVFHLTESGRVAASAADLLTASGA